MISNLSRNHMTAWRDPSRTRRADGLAAAKQPSNITLPHPRRIDFASVNAAALQELPTLLARWLPDGRINGREYEARNPRRNDRSLGSFRVNTRTGRWADFATGEKGGDPVSLAAYLFNLSQIEAAGRLADMLRVR
jgi:hypothetical protein